MPMDIIERAARALSNTLQHHGVEMDPEDVRDAVLDVTAFPVCQPHSGLEWRDCSADWRGSDWLPTHPTKPQMTFLT